MEELCFFCSTEGEKALLAYVLSKCIHYGQPIQNHIPQT